MTILQKNNLLNKILKLPVLKEYISGQQFSYVCLSDVTYLVEEHKPPNLKTLLNVLRVSIPESSPMEIHEACDLILTVLSLAPNSIEVLTACFERGPLSDGDIPSKTGKDTLISLGFLTKVVVKTVDSQNAITQKGFYAYKLLKAGLLL